MAEPRRPVTRRPPAPRRPARPPAPRPASTITRASSSQQRAIREIARRLIWWQTPDRALAQPRRFLAQVMALGTWDDIVAVRQVYGDDALRAVLADPPPGVFDPRSWHYWHAVFGIDPVPPLPRRFEGQRPDDDDRTATERPDGDRTTGRRRSDGDRTTGRRRPNGRTAKTERPDGDDRTLPTG